MIIPYNKPKLTGFELDYIREAHANGHLAGDGAFSRKCHHWLESTLDTKLALLTHSCTAALEMSALLLDLGPGDEVIMPSYTFVSTANAFVLRGATPVFIDIRNDTLNMDETLIEDAISSKTKAIVAVHYAGVACEMDAIMQVADKFGLPVIEDAAQALMAKYKGRSLGSIGDFGTLSFHETKNIISGEGGAILVNNEKYAARAEIIREKGTNRSAFFRGESDKYTWVDVGSSYLPSELTAAFLWAQMNEAERFTRQRLAIWETYHAAFADAQGRGLVERPNHLDHCDSNGHIYYLILPSEAKRDAFIAGMMEKEIHCVFHYVPLHNSPFGKTVSRSSGEMTVTQSVSARLVRLPMWIGVEEHQNLIIDTAIHLLSAS